MSNGMALRLATREQLDSTGEGGVPPARVAFKKFSSEQGW
jgi:hypothetical protein